MGHPKDLDWAKYLYGELSSDQRAEISAHLDSCGECRDQLETWRQTMGDLDEWGAVRQGGVGVYRLTRVFSWAAMLLVLSLGPTV